MRRPTPELFRGLARSSPWRWRALTLDLHRRPLHGPEHTVQARVERGAGVEVRLADGRHTWPDAARSRAGWVQAGAGDRQGRGELPFAWELPVDVDAEGFVVRRPPAPWTTDDRVWQEHPWVAMLDPVELADGSWPSASPHVHPDAGQPPALDLHRLDGRARRGRETWWAEASPRAEYSPRCEYCPLLGGATSFLVALDVATGVCVHVEHLDGDHVGRGFSMDLRTVDGS